MSQTGGMVIKKVFMAYGFTNYTRDKTLRKTFFSIPYLRENMICIVMPLHTYILFVKKKNINII